MCKETKEQEVVDLIRLYQDYSSLYKTNEVAAEKLFVGSLTTITGIVDIVRYDYDKNEKYMVAIVDISEMSGFKANLMEYHNTIKCRFKDSELQNVIKLKKGDIVTIDGTFNGRQYDNLYSYNPLLSDCVVRQQITSSKYSQGEIQW